jgi:hypothetical protein
VFDDFAPEQAMKSEQVNAHSNCVKEVDYKHLQYVLAVLNEFDYHTVVKNINANWASRINFQLKLN